MNTRVPFLLLLFLAAAFGLGLAQLFKLRLASGDVYPPYSSLRSDPLGTMALYESLEKIPAISVSRDFSSENRLPEERHTTYLHLAARASEWEELPESLVKEIEGFAMRGGRLAVTFFPVTSRPYRFASDEEEPDSKKAAARKKRERERKEQEKGTGLVSLKDRWGLELEFAALDEDNAGAYRPARVSNQSDPALPQTLDWHSGLVFTNLAHPWRTLYSRGLHPVVIERPFGSGAIAMATDSYFLSNEALRKDRHADLLAWLVGPAQRVVFDEGHLGILDQAGVAVLMRKYRLTGLVAGLVLLAGLFIWKNSMSFVPLPMEAEVQSAVAGKDAASGFVNLLRRNISPANLLNVCFAEWKKTHLVAGRQDAARVEQAEALLSADETAHAGDLVARYQAICRELRVPTAIQPLQGRDDPRRTTP